MEKNYFKNYVEKSMTRIPEKSLDNADGENGVGGAIRKSRYAKDKEIGKAINDYFSKGREKDRKWNRFRKKLYTAGGFSLLFLWGSIIFMNLDNMQKRKAISEEINKTQGYNTTIRIKDKELGPESIIKRDKTDMSELEFKINSHFDYSPDSFVPVTLAYIDYSENKDKSSIGLHVPTSEKIRKNRLGGFIGKDLSDCSKLCHHSIKIPSKEGVYRLIFQTYKLNPNYSLVKGLKKKDILLEEKVFPLVIGNPKHKIFMKDVYSARANFNSKLALDMINLGDKTENFELAIIRKYLDEGDDLITIPGIIRKILGKKRRAAEFKEYCYESKTVSLKPYKKETIIFDKDGYNPSADYYDFTDCTYVGIKRKGEEKEIIASDEDVSSLIFNLHGKDKMSVLKAIKLYAIGPGDDFFIDSATKEFFYYFRKKGLFDNKTIDSNAPYILKEIGWSGEFKKQREQQK